MACGRSIVQSLALPPSSAFNCESSRLPDGCSLLAMPPGNTKASAGSVAAAFTSTHEAGTAIWSCSMTVPGFITAIFDRVRDQDSPRVIVAQAHAIPPSSDLLQVRGLDLPRLADGDLIGLARAAVGALEGACPSAGRWALGLRLCELPINTCAPVTGLRPSKVGKLPLFEGRWIQSGCAGYGEVLGA